MIERDRKITLKIIFGWFLLITAIIFPLAWPVLIGLLVLESAKRRARKAEYAALAPTTRQPVRVPNQMGAL